MHKPLWSAVAGCVVFAGIIIFQFQASHPALEKIPVLASRAVPTPVSVSSPPAKANAKPSVTGPAQPTAMPRAPEFQQWAGWVERYEAADAPVRATLLEAGRQLASARRAALKALIMSDPEATKALAVSPELRNDLPPEISSLLENHISGQADYGLNCVLPPPEQTGRPGGAEPAGKMLRTVIWNGRQLVAHVSGEMTHSLSAKNVALEGIALDDQMALWYLQNAPVRAYGDAALGSSDVANRPLMSWTHGAKKVLIIRVDFPDLPGTPVSIYGTNTLLTPAFIASVFNGPGGVRGFYTNSSFGQTDLIISEADVSPVYRMPTNAAIYAATADFYDIEAAAYAAASTNYNLSQYDRIGVVNSYLGDLTNSAMYFTGIASVGAGQFYINGAMEFQTVAHELGHTYGLEHADWWDPPSGTAIGTEADLAVNLEDPAIGALSIEYGDNYDDMGGQGLYTPDARFEFNPWFKNLLGWIPDTAVQTVTNSGVYRVYRFDGGSADLVNNKLALKVCRDITRNYWVGYRGSMTNLLPPIVQGAYVLFGYHFVRESDLLACNPNGLTVDNAMLAVGESLVDTNGGVTFTTLDQGGTGAGEYLDMQVTLQPRVSFFTNSLAVQTTTNAIQVEVDRLGGSLGTTTVHYTTVDGTAFAGTNYTASAGTLTWGPGDNSPRFVPVTFVPQPASAGGLAFSMQLTNSTNGVIINPGTLAISLLPAGNLDPYFYSTASPFIYALAVQPDGNVLAGGQIYDFEGAPAAGYVRMTADGSRDFSFLQPFSPYANPNYYNQIYALRLQTDGKILVGGNFTNLSPAFPAVRTYLARLNQDGTMDTNFIPPGISWGAGYPEPAPVFDMAVQPDGKIVVVGDFYDINGAACETLCRLNPDGTVDFVYNPADYYTSYALQGVALGSYSAASPNGVRIYAAGVMIPNTNYLTDVGVICLRPDGSMDPNFNTGAGAAGGDPYSVAVQPDGKILAGGDFTSFEGNYPQLVRLNLDGSVDPTFRVSLGGPNPLRVLAILPQPDGKILIGGIFSSVNGVAEHNMARLTATGALDLTWDNGTGTNNGDSIQVKQFALRPDGEVLVAGSGIIRGEQKNPTESFYPGMAALYTGITNLYGLGQFAANVYGIRPGTTLQIPVERVNGSDGAVRLDYGTQTNTAVAGVDIAAAQGTLSWAAGDASVRGIAVTCNPAARAGRTFALNLAIPNGGLQLGAPGQAVFTVSTNYSYGIWAAEQFSPAQQVNSGISGIAATPAGDGVQNLLKYAFGLNPFTTVTNSLLNVTLTNNHARILFNRDASKVDLTYQVQVSSDLLIWSPLAISTGGNATTNTAALDVFEHPGNNGTFNVTVDDLAPVSTTAQRFLRLAVSLGSP